MSRFFRAFGLVCLAGVGACAPGDGQKEYGLGEKAYELHNLKKAEKYFQKSVEINAANVNAHIMLSRVRLDLGEIASANKAIETAASLADGEDFDILMTKGQIAYHMKNYDSAMSLFKKVAANYKLDRITRSKALSSLGIVQMTCDRRDEARVSFMMALNLDRKNNPSAFYHLGLLYRDAFDYPEAAQEQFEMFVRLQAAPRERVNKVQRDILPLLRDSIMRATSQIPNVSRRDSQASAALLAKAEAQYAKKKYRDALKYYRESLFNDPLSYPAQLGIAKVLDRDTTLAGQKAAFKAYLAACKLKPNSTSTHLHAAAMAMRLSQPMTAARLYSRALATNPVKRDAIDGLIRAYEMIPGNQTLVRIYKAYRSSL